MEINSLQNQKIKNIIKLKKASERKKQGVFVVEGEREIKIAIKSGLELLTHYVCDFYNKNKENLLSPDSVLLSVDVFNKVSNRESPDGNIAIFKIQKKSLNELKLNENGIILILDQIEKPGNLGAIARTADAGGIDAIFLSDSKVDIYNPNAIRTSQGTVFSIPIISLNRDKILEFSKKNKIKILATTPRAEKEYLKCDFSGRIGILMGAEDKGLDKEWLNAANEQIKIEMKGNIDSLNLSVSTAILIFEALRQRK